MLHDVAEMEANVARFVRRVSASGQLWGLRSESGWANCDSNDEECIVLLFWSDMAYARRHAIQDWSGYAPTPIPLDAFLTRWLPGMQADGVLAGVNFNADLAGLELAPRALADLLVAAADADSDTP